jgi:hypothetical protein
LEGKIHSPFLNTRLTPFPTDAAAADDDDDDDEKYIKNTWAVNDKRVVRS